ncbi:hypothetical protein, partial [Tsukamurella soli]
MNMRPALRTNAAVMAAAAAVGVTAALMPMASTPSSSAGIRLVDSSVVNIPQNLADMIADIPANELAGIDSMNNGMVVSGNWWQYQPGNVIGFDQGDLAKVNGVAAMLIPVPSVAQALADQFNVIAEAEFPMTAGCTGVPGPCNSATYWTPYFTVTPWTLLSGYDFGTVVNTIDPSIPIPWSDTTGTLNPFGEVEALWDTLTATPTGVEAVPSLSDYATALADLGESSFNDLNPFVSGTYCLPCQIVVPGAPDSQSRIPLFGQYYTFTDLGQALTPTDWAGHADPTAPDGNVDALNFWSAEGQETFWSDAVSSLTDPAYDQAGLESELTQTADFLQTEYDNYSPWVSGAPSGITDAAATVLGEGAAFASDIASSLGLPAGTGTSLTSELPSAVTAPAATPTTGGITNTVAALADTVTGSSSAAAAAPAASTALPAAVPAASP